MDWLFNNIYWTIFCSIGVIIGFFVGVKDLIKWIKGYKYPRTLNYYDIDRVKLLATSAEENSDVKISIKDEVFNKNVVFFRGLFRNEGALDIEMKKDDIYDNVTITLPEGYDWIQASIIEKSSEGIISEVLLDKENKRKAVFYANKIRRNEYVLICGYINASTDRDSGKSFFSFSHRISDTNPVKYIKYETPRKRKKMIPIIILAFIAILFMVLILFIESRSLKWKISYKDNNSPTQEVGIVIPVSENIVHVYQDAGILASLDLGDYREFKFSEFQQRFSIIVKNKMESENKLFVYLPWITIVAYLLLLFIELYPIFKANKLSKILKQIDKSSK